ncbi:MAG: NAD-binding protein [Candidatus Micrarchaeales archaeon]|jgi:K+ transport systems, NAD-binding component|uniref:TrkA-N domain protein n=1 Tax=Candidatus Micrarchaeum acidiphilum ARMAN-2 TaxID=425595 RepID=C7DGS1_MICA2|nr:MAG: TrkA-N domain protein [Candidatus Micrarchaeum acidiphilum ARMAN-2]MCW6161530.1 NAD-binding protein [Candidatus Micrarchaeales archaeon]
MENERLYAIIIFSFVIFFISYLLTVSAGLDPVSALLWNALAAMDIRYFSLPIGIGSSAQILLADMLDVLVFVMFTVWVASIFFDFIKSVRVRDKIIESKIKKLSAHTIVAPYNGFASTFIDAAEKKGVKVTVVSESEKGAERAYRNGNLVILGDPASSLTFEKAGIRRALYLVACSEDDMENTLIAISAKAGNSKIRIIARSANLGSISKLEHAGAYRIIMPEIAAGEDMANELLKRVI